MKVIFAAGGTGGHINPALAAAGELRRRHPDAEILFIGTSDHMESRLVPQAGFDFKTMEKLTAAAFGQRRKMLRSSLKTLGLMQEQIEQMCDAADVPTSFRGEQVSVDKFCQMARWLYQNG